MTLETQLDSATRKRHGVYYTPQPAVDYLCRSTAYLLQQRFSDHQSWIVDPACGDGRFLSSAAELCPDAQLAGIDIMPEAVACAQRSIGDAARIECDNPLARDTSDYPWHATDALAVVGNPPYHNFGTKPEISPSLAQWLQQYRTGLNEQKSNLADLYIHFLGWAHQQIDRVGRGVIAFVLNHAFLSGPTFRVLRQQLCEYFESIWILDLHGNATRRERTPAGGKDENIFDIRTGVTLFMALKDGASPRTLRHAELWGARSAKLRYLEHHDVRSTSWQTLIAQPPANLFVPATTADDRYEAGWPLDQVFQQYTSGVQTKRDSVFVALSRDQLRSQITELLAGSAGEVPPWLAQRLPGRKFDSRFIRPYVVAPFDLRWIYYDPQLLGRARYSVMQHMLSQPNTALIFMRQSTNPGPYDQFFCSRHLASDRCLYSAQGAPFVAPLFCDGESNLSPAFCGQLESIVGGTLAPADVFNYIVGALHQEEYLERNLDHLRRDFPRVLLPQSANAFRDMVQLGADIEQTQADIPDPPEPGREPCPSRRKYPSFSAGTIHINDRQKITNVATDAWTRTIGGYQVIRRWLKQRRDHYLSSGEMAYLTTLANMVPSSSRVDAARV